MSHTGSFFGSCGQKGHYARECPTGYDYRDFQPREGQDIIPNEDTTYPLQIGDKPHIVDGYLYRPTTSSFMGKPSSYPVKSYSSDQPTGGAYRKEKEPERRGVEKKYTPPPPRTTSRKCWRWCSWWRTPR